MLFSAIRELLGERKPYDPVTVIEQKSSKIGGFMLSDLLELTMSVSTQAVFPERVKSIIENHRRKLAIELGNKILKEAKEKPIDEVISKINQGTMDLLNIGMRTKKTKTERVSEYISEKENQFTKGVTDKISTGYKDLDEILQGGFQKGNLITLFARSGVGKTTLAINMAIKMALNNYKTVFYTTEMGERELVDKFVASDIELDYSLVQNMKKLKEHESGESHFARMINSMSKYDMLPLDVVDDAGTHEELTNDVMLRALGGKVQIIFVDYVQLFCQGSQGNNLTEKLGDLTISLKRLAQEYGLVVIALAQANRMADARKNDTEDSFKLKKADIQDSARIEQNSNMVFGITRNDAWDDFKYKQTNKSDINYQAYSYLKNPEFMNLQILKNRSGITGNVALRYVGRYSKVKDF
jgi:replicative DNA helicase